MVCATQCTHRCNLKKHKEITDTQKNPYTHNPLCWAISPPARTQDITSIYVKSRASSPRKKWTQWQLEFAIARKMRLHGQLRLRKKYQRVNNTRTHIISSHLYSSSMLFSGAKPTHARKMFSSIARCFAKAFTQGVSLGTKGAFVR